MCCQLPLCPTEAVAAELCVCVAFTKGKIERTFSKGNTVSLSPRQLDQSGPAQFLENPENITNLAPLFKKFIFFKNRNIRNSMSLSYQPLKYVRRKLDDYGTTSDLLLGMLGGTLFLLGRQH